ncbi:MAG: hypothetical protein BWY78_00100 [Alphaproteobacteria bacterium ADurb.Bin438]|nr:MAG: hypothetical protein BWY78_00100 [Alphaproteobacteria bacterium ADurb.Bin438]
MSGVSDYLNITESLGLSYKTRAVAYKNFIEGFSEKKEEQQEILQEMIAKIQIENNSDKNTATSIKDSVLMTAKMLETLSEI